MCIRDRIKKVTGDIEQFSYNTSISAFMICVNELFCLLYTSVMSTRCHMLAMYVVLENHLTSLCDTPKAYEGQPGFEVLRTVQMCIRDRDYILH